MAKGWTVVENAGYEGECDVHSAKTFIKATRWMVRRYDAPEIESLHVVIRRDGPEGGTYEY